MYVPMWSDSTPIFRRMLTCVHRHMLSMDSTRYYLVVQAPSIS